MSDFLDNLIARHVDGVPQIKPRLPSVFEPEVSRGRSDVVAFDNSTAEMEETDFLPSAQVTIPTASPTVVESLQPEAARAPMVLAREEKLFVKGGLNESVFSFSPRERAGVRDANSTTDPLTHSPMEGGRNEGLPKPSATLIVPVMGRARGAHQAQSMERVPSDSKATAEDQSPVRGGLNESVFSFSPRERVGVREANATSDPLSRREGGLNQGLLKPSAHLIAPVIPSLTGPKRPISQPEPVINVTIGRIEVRATMSPQKQAPKPESRTPVMGLEEYLRRRSGGQDR